MYDQLLTSELEILADAERLLELASAGEGRRFNRLQERYLQKIEELKMLRGAVTINDEQRDVLLKLALSLVRIDARIRRIVDPGQARAEQWLARNKPAGQPGTSKIKPVGA